MAGEAEGSMTLVLALSALRRLDRPADTIADASAWSEHVGVVGADATAVTAAVEAADANPDFVSGEGGVAGSLSAIRQRLQTDRHVFVAAAEPERATARALGWESLAVADAAAKANWSLVDHDTEE